MKEQRLLVASTYLWGWLPRIRDLRSWLATFARRRTWTMLYRVRPSSAALVAGSSVAAAAQDDEQGGESEGEGSAARPKVHVTPLTGKGRGLRSLALTATRQHVPVCIRIRPLTSRNFPRRELLSTCR